MKITVINLNHLKIMISPPTQLRVMVAQPAQLRVAVFPTVTTAQLPPVIDGGIL